MMMFITLLVHVNKSRTRAIRATLTVESLQVGFLGISNWAVDPAKTNRGILVQRDVPDKDELLATAMYVVLFIYFLFFLFFCFF
jgi:hypothetical protein